MKEAEFLNQLLAEENGRRLTREGFTLRVTVKAARKPRHELVQRQVTAKEWEEILKSLENRPDYRSFLRIVRDTGNDPLSFTELSRLSEGWLTWSTLSYLNTILRTGALPYRFSYPPTQRRLHWQIRTYRLYPVR